MSEASSVKHCRTFIVRTWLEPNGEAGGVWRASAMNALTQKKVYFSSPEALSSYLVAQLPPARAARE